MPIKRPCKVTFNFIPFHPPELLQHRPQKHRQRRFPHGRQEFSKQLPTWHPPQSFLELLGHCERIWRSLWPESQELRVTKNLPELSADPDTTVSAPRGMRSSCGPASPAPSGSCKWLLKQTTFGKVITGFHLQSMCTPTFKSKHFHQDFQIALGHSRQASSESSLPTDKRQNKKYSRKNNNNNNNVNQSRHIPRNNFIFTAKSSSKK